MVACDNVVIVVRGAVDLIADVVVDDKKRCLGCCYYNSCCVMVGCDGVNVVVVIVGCADVDVVLCYMIWDDVLFCRCVL